MRMGIAGKVCNLNLERACWSIRESLRNSFGLEEAWNAEKFGLPVILLCISILAINLGRLQKAQTHIEIKVCSYYMELPLFELNTQLK